MCRKRAILYPGSTIDASAIGAKHTRGRSGMGRFPWIPRLRRHVTRSPEEERGPVAVDAALGLDQPGGAEGCGDFVELYGQQARQDEGGRGRTRRSSSGEAPPGPPLTTPTAAEQRRDIEKDGCGQVGHCGWS